MSLNLNWQLQVPFSDQRIRKLRDESLSAILQSILGSLGSEHCNAPGKDENPGKKLSKFDVLEHEWRQFTEASSTSKSKVHILV